MKNLKECLAKMSALQSIAKVGMDFPGSPVKSKSFKISESLLPEELASKFTVLDKLGSVSGSVLKNSTLWFSFGDRSFPKNKLSLCCQCRYFFLHISFSRSLLHFFYIITSSYLHCLVSSFKCSNK